MYPVSHNDEKRRESDSPESALQAINSSLARVPVVGARVTAMISAAGGLANVIDEQVNVSAPNLPERLACAVMGHGVSQTIQATMYVEAGIVGARMQPLPHPLARVAGAISGMVASSSAINEAVRPIEPAVRTLCHAAFSSIRQATHAIQPPVVQSLAVESRNPYQAYNLIAPPYPFGQSLANNQLFNMPFHPRYNSFNLSDKNMLIFKAESAAKLQLQIRYGYVSDRLFDQIKQSISSNVSSYLSSSCYSNFSFNNSPGYFEQNYHNNYWVGCSNFVVIMMTNRLIDSYNSYNPKSHIFGRWKYSGKDIGGVATEVSTITDLVDSTTHAEAEHYYICLPKSQLPFSDAMVEQMKAELANAYYNHDTLPFFSLHFNQHGILYPVIHPAFQNTLIGNVIGMLDYWMKGFLNGGVFDETFLQQWHETENCDETLLRSKVVDLKQYCRDHQIRYFSLRELESRYGLEDKSSNSAFSQPFMTSFRIISEQEKIDRHDNILVPSPTFRVEYSVDLMPDYKEYVDAHIREHGCYPPAHQQMLNCYELFAEEIKNTMPSLPFCRDYFQLLGIINSFSYFYATLDKMGKRPVLDMPEKPLSYSFPKSLPPIPVRYYRTYPIDLSFESILKKLVDNDEKKALFDSAFIDLFSSASVFYFPKTLQEPLEKVIKDLIRQQMTDKLSSEDLQSLNEEEISKISKKISQTIMSIANIQFRTLHKVLDTLLLESKMPISTPEQQKIINAPLPQKFHLISMKLQSHCNFFRLRYLLEKNSRLSQKTPTPVGKFAFQQLPTELHPLVEQTFNRIEKSLENITQELMELDAALTNQENKVLNKLHQKKTILADKIAELKEWINEAKTHQASQLAKIPPYEHKNYLPQIQELEASTNQAITHYNGGIATLQSTVDELDQNINDIPQKTLHYVKEENTKAIERFKECFETNEDAINGFKSMVKQFTDSRGQDMESRKTALQQLQLETTNLACKNVAIKILKNYVESVTEQMSQRRDSVIHFSSTLLDIPPSCQTLVAERYTHSFIGFTGKKLDEQIGEHFKIVGGCGLSVPNMQSTPLEHAEQFIASMESYQGEAESNTISFTHNATQWIAYKIPVRDHLTLINNQLAEYKLAKELSADLSVPKEVFLSTSNSFGNLRIHLAAQSGDVEAVANILNTAPDLVHAKNKQAMTALMVATQFGHMAVVALLHTKGADFNYSSPNGLFPLYVAIERNFHDMARWMIQNVTNLCLDQELDSKMTALHAAIENESVELANYLIEKGARCDIPRKSDGYTALHCAASMGYVELLATMQQRGITLNMPLESKKTPMHLAAQAGKTQVLAYLLEQAISTSEKTIEADTALTLAIKSGHLEAALLLAQHTPINLTNGQQQTSSLLALLYGMPRVGDRLIERGENPTLLDKQETNYLYYLVRNGEYQRFNRLLKTQQIDVNQIITGNSLLAIAAQHGHFLLVYALLDASATYVSNTKKTLMHYAILADDIGYLREYKKRRTRLRELACLSAREGSMQCLDWLLKTIPLSDNRRVALIKNGIIGNHEKILTLLLKYCPDLNTILDNEGNTFLHFAVKKGSDKAVSLLLTHGCKPQIRNNSDETAFHIAYQQDDAELLKRLFKLSHPGDWPVDLWQLTIKKDKDTIQMTQVLKKYQKRLPEHAVSKQQPKTTATKKSNSTGLQTTLNPSLLLTTVISEQLSILKSHLAYSDFEAATNLICRSNDLIAVFLSTMGGTLLQQLIGNISDFDTFKEQFCSSSSSSTSPSLKPIDKLLSLLREKGVNPALHTGKNNPLLAMIGAENDTEACYQLDVFTRHFPECIPVLARDKLGSKLNITMLSIKRSKTALFEKLDVICRQQQDATYSGLHEAVAANNYALTERMLAFYSVDKTNPSGQTALMLAAANGNVAIINLLLQHGASPSEHDKRGQQVMHYALKGNDDRAALALVPVLKNPNQPDRNGLTPLMLAANKGMIAVVRFLCDAGNFLNHTEKFGKHALHYAAETGQTSSVEHLISIGLACDLTEVPTNPAKAQRCLKRTPLHIAALGGHTETVLRLLELGADPLKEDSRGNTFIEYAIRSKNERLLNLTKLMPAYHQLERDTTMLHATVQADNTEILRELIDDTVDLNATNKMGHSAIHLAVLSNSPAVLELLLQDKNVTANAVDQWGNTALHYAALKGQVRLVEYLLHAGVKSNIQNQEGCTPLYLACEGGHSGAVAALLKGKVDIALKSADGLNPLDVAIKQGHSDVVNQLKRFSDGVANAFTRHRFYAATSVRNTTELLVDNTTTTIGHK